MGLTEKDRDLLLRCLGRRDGAWEEFVDRFMGLVLHVINHTAASRNLDLNQGDIDELTSEIFFAAIKDDFAALRHFRGQSSLSTYLTVIARRVCVRYIVRNGKKKLNGTSLEDIPANASSVEKILEDKEEVNRLINGLEGKEAQIVRLYHLEGKSYKEISEVLDMPENSIGPTLTRAREKMRAL